MRYLCYISLAILVAACNAGEATESPAVSGVVEGEVQGRTNVSFDGYIVPANATELRAPQNTFRVAGWNSNSSWIKLKNIVDDGKEVEEGEPIAWFEFDGKRALPRVEEGIQRAEANRDRSNLSVGSTVEEMQTAEQRKQIEARRAELDTRKEGVVSERDLERYRIARKQAEFEAAAQGKTLAAYQKSVRAERLFQDRSVDRANADMTRYKQYEERFKVAAPHDGVVRHAFMRWRRRKVQKGDGMRSGTHFMSVARDDALTVEFFIPESSYPLTLDQKEWVVRSPSSNEVYAIEVVKVDEFPQELGFLKEDESLPNAREKMYVIHARFVDQPEELSAGLEVEVSLP